MTQSSTLNYVAPTLQRRPRIVTGIVLVVLQWLIIKVPEWVAPATMVQFMAMMWGPILGALAVIVWWVAFSRFPWRVRLTGLIGYLGCAITAFAIKHPSMPMVMVMHALPLVTTLFVLWAAIGRYFGNFTFRVGLVAIPLAVWATFSLLRMEGLNGNIHATLAWRWSQTSEDRYLASRAAQQPAVNSVTHATTASTAPTTLPTTLSLSPGDWPGFRGSARDSKLSGVSINTQWTDHPPKLLWRHLIGPGWGSFCVIGDRLFTQEQRGDFEAVVCDDLNTGAELWAHQDKTRFSESIAGPGPRATPTFANGKLYCLGATGQLNCLNPLTGDVIWTQNVAADAGAPIPMWGFASSPLVANGLVTIITGGKGKSVLAYNADTGKVEWSAGEGFSYSSTQLAHFDGIDQVLYVNAEGLTSLDPQTGQTLWQHHFPLPASANRVTQPLILNDHEFLLGAAFGTGTRRVRLTHEGSSWKQEDLWTSRSLKPYYNDMVLQNNFLYGFDNNVFVCVDPNDGKTQMAHPRLRQRPSPAPGRPKPAPDPLRTRRGGTGRSQARRPPRDHSLPGNPGKNVEPSSHRAREIVGAQRRRSRVL